MEEMLQSPIVKLGKRLSPGFNKAKELSKTAGTLGLEAAKQTGKAMKDTALPKAAELAKKSVEYFTVPDNQPAAVTEDSSKPSVVEIIPSRTKRARIHLEALAAAAESRLEHENADAPQTARPAEIKPVPAYQAFFTVTIPRFFFAATVSFLTWFKERRNKRITALVVAVLIILVTLSLVLRPHHSTGNSTVSDTGNGTLLQQVTTLKTQIATDITQNSLLDAGKLINQAQQALNSLKNPSASQTQQANTLWSALAAQSAVANRSVTLGVPAATYTLASSGTGFFTNLPYFYGWGSNNPTLIRTGRGETSQVQASVPLTDSSDNIVSGTATTETGAAGYVLTNQDKVYRVIQNGSTTLLHAITPETGSFAAGDVLSTYNGNLYILDGKTGLLWKYANTGTGYAKGTSVIDINKYDIKNSVSFAVDGSFYILKADGSVQRFTGGKQDDYTLKDGLFDAQNMTNPTKIVTDQSYSDFYILDAGATSALFSTTHILDYSKSGSYVREYTLPSTITKVNSFTIDPQNKELWVLSDYKIYEFTLP